MEFVPAPPVLRVLCADCGTPIVPNSANLCVACLRNTIDITEGIPKQSSVSFCRNCERFLSPPLAWMLAKPESSELLSICLKRLKGLNKVRLTEAHFIWTEPHSKRLRVSMTIQKEVLTNTILEQTFEIEYLVQHAQCPDCTKLAAKNTWQALVQVRQKVPHKRTFLFLEQLILKHSAQKDTISVKEVKDGLDFFYSQRNHAIKMVEFLASVVPIRSKSSEQIISSDTHSNTATFKFTYSVEIPPICKDDLVCMSLKQARSLSNISPLTICTRVGNALHLIDPMTLQSCDITGPVFWRAPFESLATVSELVEFTILDIEVDYSVHHGRSHANGNSNQNPIVKSKYVLADAQVALAGAFRSSSSKKNHDPMGMGMDMDSDAPQIFHTRTHLGAILQPGDTALGYHLTSANYNDPNFSSLSSSRVPDVILVKKSYPNRRKKNKNHGNARPWKLRSIAKEAGEEGETGGGRGVVGRLGGRDRKKVEEDYEMFLRELEEDPEMRGAVNLYKAPEVKMVPVGSGGRGKKKGQFAMEVDTEGDEEIVKTTIEGIEGAGDGEDNEAEVDFPEVTLDELLEEFDEMTIGNGAAETVE